MENIEIKELKFEIEPKILTLVVTYKCSASCNNCCFSCNPDRNEFLSKNDAIGIITESVESFPKLSLLVITGGEPLLQGTEYLTSIIQHAKKSKLHTRLVTNGFWAISSSKANKILSSLVNAGLDELNLSTGDDHLEYVSVDNVIRAAIEAVKLKTNTVINIEGHANSKFTPEDLEKNTMFKEFFNDQTNRLLIKVINGLWIPINNKGNIEYDQKGLKMVQDMKKGCDSILDTISIFPDKSLKSCCGLIVNEVKEFKLGYLDGNNMKGLFSQQFANFINIWLKLDGPYKIFNSLAKINPNLKLYELTHTCMVCSLFFNDEEVRETLLSNYHKFIPEVFFKYQIHKQLNNL